MIISEGLLLSIILVPLFGSILSYLFGMVRKEAAAVMGTIVSFLSFAVAIILFQKLTPGRSFEFVAFDWIQTSKISIPFLLRYDSLTAVMCLVITGVGSLIHLYSIGYMAHDESVARFFAYLNLFLASMLTLVLGGSLPVVFIGWEGVGLCSYLLIGFWYTERAYAEAGKKAFVMNRIGDVGFLVATFTALYAAGSVEIATILSWVASGTADPVALTVVAAALFVAATGKSAQIPLFTWLPDAMAGPTPVSALIHAATMVTAGIYLVARMAPVFDACPGVLAVIMVVALATAFVSATIALLQDDIKKVLAYSTVSQLGFMFMAAAAGAYWVALFHVVTHAFFKACLFLSAGSVIHGCHHEQDMRRMGGLAKAMPVTALCYGVSTLAIAGVWPFAGYFSKHAILGAIDGTANPYLAPYAGVLGIVATAVAVLTAFYMTRSFVMTFLGRYRGEHAAHESGIVMLVPIVVLAGLACIGGWYLDHRLPEFLGAEANVHGGAGFAAAAIGSLPGVFGIAIALALYLGAPQLPKTLFIALRPVSILVKGKYFIDEVYQVFIVAPLRYAAKLLWAKDERTVDGAVYGVGYVTEATGEVLRRLETGQVSHYVFIMWLGAALLLGFYVIP